MADQNKNKRLQIIIGIVLGVAIIALLVLFLPPVITLMQTGAVSPQITVPDRTSEDDQKSISEELEKLLQNDGFMDTFSCFYYPGSEVQSYRSIGETGDFLYFILEVDQDFSQVEEFYRNKKVQSIWTQSQFYEKSLFDAELQFLEDADTLNTSKYTYHSTDQDKIVNVLISSMDAHTQIMVMYWEP